MSAFSSVSLEPPQVLVCVSRWSKLNEMVLAAEAFAVNILADDQRALSDYFSRPGRHPVKSFVDLGLPYSMHSTGMPILEGVAAFFDCSVAMACESGDHSIFIGDVLVAGADEAKAPLLFYKRRYRSVGDWEA